MGAPGGGFEPEGSNATTTTTTGRAARRGHGVKPSTTRGMFEGAIRPLSRSAPHEQDDDDNDDDEKDGASTDIHAIRVTRSPRF
jgi:hypothetical protein